MTSKFIEELAKNLREVKDDDFVFTVHIKEGSEEVMYFGSNYKKSYMLDAVYEAISIYSPDVYREFKKNKVVENQFKASNSKLSLMTLLGPNEAYMTDVYFGTGKQFKNFVEAGR